MKLLVCVSLIVVLLNEFNCAPLIQYERHDRPAGYYDEKSSSNSWGYNLEGRFNVGAAGGYKNGQGYLRTDNDIGLSIGGYKNDGSRQTRYPINSAYGNGNPYESAYGSYKPPNSPSYEGSNSQSHARPNHQSYNEESQSEPEGAQRPQRRRPIMKMRRLRTTTATPLYDEINEY